METSAPVAPPGAASAPHRAFGGSRGRAELAAFLFLTAFVMPALAVAVVGGYGLAVWLIQMMVGPPGPPAP